jgi:hypothetical protein
LRWGETRGVAAAAAIPRARDNEGGDNSELGVSFQIIETPKDFRADSTCGLASQPGSALDRSVMRDFKATEQEILASNNLKDKRRTISTRPSLKHVKMKCAFCYAYLIRLERRHVRPERISLPSFLSGRHSRFGLQKR